MGGGSGFPALVPRDEVIPGPHRQLSNGVPWFYVDIPSFPVFMEGKVDVTQTHNGHI